MVCLAFGFILVLREVGCNRKDCRAGLGGEEGYGEVWLVLRWYVYGLDGWVCVFMDCEYSTARAAFGGFIIE